MAFSLASRPIEHVWRSSYASNGCGAKVTFLGSALCLAHAQILAVSQGNTFTQPVYKMQRSLWEPVLPHQLFPAHGPMPSPTPPLCSSFRNTEELTALVSTGKSAWLQREQGIAVIPRLLLPGPSVFIWAEGTSHSFLSRVTFRSFPTAARQSQHAGRGLTVTVLSCVCW